MKVCTRESVAAEAAERWKGQYFNRGWNRSVPFDAEGIYNALVQLGPSPNPDEVDRITGGGGWASPPWCNECGEQPPVVIMLGEEPDYDSATVWICQECLFKAAVAMDEATSRAE